MNKTLQYSDAGVDIEAGNTFVQKIKPLVAKTNRPGVMSSLGGFGALFELPVDRYRQPILVSSTDGVGTKLKLAVALNKHDTIGIDLVAMCVNDVIVCGAEPLFFLDYFATGKLNVDQAALILSGIAKGCELAGAALVGGETAEMPGIYHEHDYDLAGFVVGVAEKANLIDGSKVSDGDTLIALGSSGPHSNGYSLIRKIIELKNIDLNTPFENRNIGEVLLEPTRIYVKTVLQLCQSHSILAMSHITGGGITENLPRVLPKHLQAVINKSSWQWLPIFQWLQQQGQIAETEMYRTFNCGVGMILCVPEAEAPAVLKTLANLDETAWQIGKIQMRAENSAAIIFE